MPDEIYNELVEYLEERDKKMRDNEQGFDNSFVKAETEFVGRELRPSLFDQLDITDDTGEDKIQQVQGMNEVGTQEKLSPLGIANHEGMRRALKNKSIRQSKASGQQRNPFSENARSGSHPKNQVQVTTNDDDVRSMEVQTDLQMEAFLKFEKSILTAAEVLKNRDVIAGLASKTQEYFRGQRSKEFTKTDYENRPRESSEENSYNRKDFQSKIFTDPRQFSRKRMSLLQNQKSPTFEATNSGARR